MTADVVDPASGEEKRNRYNRIAREANLVSIVLESVNFKTTPSGVNSGLKNFNRSINSDVSEVTFNPESGLCVSKVNWSVLVKEKNKKISSCNATYVVIYDKIVNADQGTVELFVENVARVSTYAYFRALFAQLDWAGLSGSPPLPVFRSNPKV